MFATFGAESSVFQFAIQKHKIKLYRTLILLLFGMGSNMVAHIEERT